MPYWEQRKREEEDKLCHTASYKKAVHVEPENKVRIKLYSMKLPLY